MKTLSPRNKFRFGIFASQIVCILTALPLLVMAATMNTGVGVPLMATGLAVVGTILGIIGVALAPLFPDE